MSGNKNALIFLWTGNSISDEMVKKIAEYLVGGNVCVPELLKAKYYDQEGINSALVKDLTNEDIVPQVIVGTSSKDVTSEAIKNAIIYIGKRFEDTLSNTKQYVPFALELDNAVREAKNNIGFNILSGQHLDDQALLNAVEVLATTNARVPSHLTKKYHITQTVIDIIVQIYNKIV